MGKTIFTIARQYGSSGRMVGRKLADQLKIHYYDRELLRLASNESGIDEELFFKADEKLKKTFFDYLARKKIIVGGKFVAVRGNPVLSVLFAGKVIKKSLF